MPFSDPIVAGDVLVRAAIQSPDYVSGVSGWQVSADGSIEAADLTIRGADGRHIRGYIEPINSIPVLDFRPADATVVGWDVSAGSAFVYEDSGFQYLGISSPVQYQPGATGEAKVELRSGQAADPSTVVSLTADWVAVNGSLYVQGVGGKTYLTVPLFTRTNSNVPATVPGFQVDLEPGATYRVETLCAYDGPLAADARFCWLVSDPLVDGARHITAPAASTTTNVDTTVTMVRRGMATQQVVGTPNGVVNGSTVYQEILYVWNNAATAQNIKLQFAQGTANATPSTLQGGYCLVERVQ